MNFRTSAAYQAADTYSTMPLLFWSEVSTNPFFPSRSCHDSFSAGGIASGNTRPKQALTGCRARSFASAASWKVNGV